MNRLVVALVIPFFIFPILIHSHNFNHVSLKTHNYHDSFFYNYARSKRTISGAQNLLKMTCLTFPTFQTLTVEEFKEVVLTRLPEICTLEEIEKIRDLFASSPPFLNYETSLLTDLSFTENNDGCSASLILGLIEIGCGALLWVTPFKQVGSGLMVDGVRRIFNELELLDRANSSLRDDS